MRRAAVLAGIVGLAAGSWIAYFQFKELMRVRAMNRMQKTVAAVEYELSSGPGDRLAQVLAAIKKAEANGADLAYKRTDNSLFVDLKALFADPDFQGPSHVAKISVLNRLSDFFLIADGGKIGSVRRLWPGEVIWETPAPDWSKYASALAFAPLGFLIPWGLVRLLAWTVAGFLPPVSRGGS
jgi:hypothetical protein